MRYAHTAMPTLAEALSSERRTQKICRKAVKRDIRTRSREVSGAATCGTLFGLGGNLKLVRL